MTAFTMAAGLLTAAGCESTSPNFVRPSSLAFAALQVTATDPASFVGSFLSCTLPNSPPGPVLRWNLPAVTVRETSGIGVAVQSFTIREVLTGGSTVDLLNNGPITFGLNFGGCGGTENRIGAGETRCTNNQGAAPVFCAFPGEARPQQLVVTISGIDDNGFPVSGQRTIAVAAAP